MSWDMNTGCWWETCAKDVDVTAEKAAFVANNYDVAQDILFRVYDKVYPYGAYIFRECRNMKGGNDCSQKFRKWFENKLGSWQSFLDAAPTALHETIHCVHGHNGEYRPGLLDNLLIFTQESNNGMNLVSDAWLNTFPKRNEIWSRFPSKVQNEDRLYYIYYKPGESISEQRILGLMTETEAYLHDVASGAWLNDGVGATRSVTPPVNVNLLDNGHPYALAYWSFANVVYLQQIKSHYQSTWNKMLQKGDTSYAQVGRLFLAHYDRFNFLLSLYIDKNDVTMTMNKELTDLLRSEKKNALAGNDVISELRTAQR